MMPGRRGARGVDLEPARAVAARLSDRRWFHLLDKPAAAPRLLDRRVDHGHGIGHRFSLGVEHAADDEHPTRGRTLGCVVWPGRDLRPTSIGLSFAARPGSRENE